MMTIKINYQSQKVNVYLKRNIFNQISKVLDLSKEYLIITDQNVGSLYLKRLTNQLQKATSFVVAPGERSKSFETVNQIINFMLSKDIGRDVTIIGLGGGVIGDLSGFIAGIYKRGVPFINIPTSLLAQVDSSIGGKTGINLGNYKNQVGLIKHPHTVIVDPLFLETLPKNELLNGYAELIKYAFTLDKTLYDLLKEREDALDELILRALSIKAKITEKDEFEQGKRKILNFGHTIGHAIESLSNFQISHGEAVALGMIYETTNTDILEKLIELLQLYKLPTEYPNFNIENIINFIKADKKRTGDLLTIPVVEQIGSSSLETLSISKWKERWQ